MFVSVLLIAKCVAWNANVKFTTYRHICIGGLNGDSRHNQLAGNARINKPFNTSG